MSNSVPNKWMKVDHLDDDDDDDEDGSKEEDDVHLQKQYQFHRIFKSCVWTIVSVLAIGVIISGIWYGAYDVGEMLPTVCIEARDGDMVGLCELIGSHYNASNPCNDELTGSGDCGEVYKWNYLWKVVENCNGLMPCDKNQMFEITEKSEYEQETKYEIGGCYECYSDSQCISIYFKNEET